jgi:hypothetical protein
MSVYLIGHLEVNELYSLRRQGDLSDFKNELATNAHFIEREHLKGLEEHPIKAERDHFSNLVIVKGKKKGSRGLLPRAIQLTKWNGKKGKYVPTNDGDDVRMGPNPGIRQTIRLDSKDTALVLNKTDSLF